MRIQHAAPVSLVLALLLLVAGSPKATHAQPLSLGLKGGVTQATFLGDDVDDAEYRTGFSGGAYFRYAFNPAFSIQPEALISQKGAEVDAGDPVLAAGEYDLWYLDIPVLFKLTAPLDGVFQPTAYAGPQLSFLLSAERAGIDIDDSLYDAEFGGLLGGELGFDLSRMNGALPVRLVLDGRYVFGFTNTFDVPGDPSIRTGTFIGSLGIEVGL